LIEEKNSMGGNNFLLEEGREVFGEKMKKRGSTVERGTSSFVGERECSLEEGGSKAESVSGRRPRGRGAIFNSKGVHSLIFLF